MTFAAAARPGRPIVESLLRGFLSAAANPVLLAAILILSFVTLAVVALSVVALLLPIGLVAVRSLAASWSARRPEDVLRALTEAIEALTRSPGLVALALVVVTVLLTALLAAVAYVRAGSAAVLYEADRRAPAGARREAFKVDARTLFFEAGRRLVGRFFWLLNVYALVVTFAALPFLVGLVLFVASLATGDHMALGVMAMLVGIPVLVVGGVAAQLATYASAREMVARDVPLLEGIGAGLSLLKRTLGRSLALYLLVVAAAMAVGAVFAFPRMALTLASMMAHRIAVLFRAADVLLFLLQTVAIGFVQLVATGSFLSLWADVPAPEAAPPAFPSPPPVHALPSVPEGSAP